VSSMEQGRERSKGVLECWSNARRLSENGYFSQSPRQAEIIILEILPSLSSGTYSVVIISAFLDLEKIISFSDNLLVNSMHQRIPMASF
jgi:hypothetical protein